MEIRVTKSGSSGNNYAVITGNEILLIECGTTAKEMLNTIDFAVKNVAGCIISHGHNDHIGYAKDYIKYGFNLLMTEESRPAESPFISQKALKRMHGNTVGRFVVIPFRVPHNETECDGFAVSHPDFGTLVFITDAEMCPHDLSKLGINHLLIECNYSDKYLNSDSPKLRHVVLGHMEKETCKRFIRKVNSDNLKTIGLIHLSKDGIDKQEAFDEITSEFPDKYVWIAERNARMIWPE